MRSPPGALARSRSGTANTTGRTVAKPSRAASAGAVLPSSDPAKRFIWLAEAAKWERQAEAEIASHVEACNAVRPTCAADAAKKLAMNPLQERAPFLLRKVRKSNRSGDYSSHQSIAIFPPKNSTALDLMPTIYLLRERSGITHLGQSLGKRAGRRRRCSRRAHRVGWILNN
jgi:hypothetical protein